ncbi:uncharacterized protein LOC123004069 [Tribolium madens]|uniref:uncharacterized protein LOC123004069 n=1 Tax=Tribolium madens TaxID=41895 RepID=UPI001CF73F24|nr:uncharacterized protein LOC123004069 [Tribolium madens]
MNFRQAHLPAFLDFDLVPLNLGAAYSWVVPKARRVPFWKAIFLTFSGFLWLVILFFLVLLATTWRFLQKGDFISSFLTILQLILESANSEITKLRTNCSRIMILATLLPFLVISSEFKSEMIRSLTSFSYEKQINSLKDIVDNGLSCNIINTVKMTYFYSNDPYKDYVQNCAIHEFEEKKDEIFDRIAYKRDVVTTSRTTQFKHALSKFYELRHKEPLLHMVPGPMVYYYIYLSKGTPFYYRFLDISSRLQAFGFKKMLFERNKSKAEAVLKSHAKIKSDDLTIEHIAVAFYLWFFGTGVAYVAFFGEIMIKKRDLNEMCFIE